MKWKRIPSLRNPTCSSLISMANATILAEKYQERNNGMAGYGKHDVACGVMAEIKSAQNCRQYWNKH